MTFDPRKPFDELPFLPPGKDLETRDVLKKNVTAARALAALNGIKNTIPNPTILINTIALQEAKISSEIENIITTNDALYKAIGANEINLDPQTKEVLAYKDAIWGGFNKLKKQGFLSTNLFIEICNQIKGTDAGIRKIPGTVLGTSSGKTIYTRPVGERVIRDKLGNLETYINNGNDGVDPLIKLAVLHYQFEAIHPFSDGNGRTGRLICILYLIQAGLLDLPILYLSKFIIERKADYQRLLLNVTKNDEWEPWVLYMLDGIEETARYTYGKVFEIKRLLEETIEKARTELPARVYSKELIELLFVNPYCKVKNVVDVGIAKRKTAVSYLDECENVGILKKQRVWKENIYINAKLLDLISK